MSALINLAGRKFTRLTVVRDTGERYVKHPIWECICDCGKTTKVIGQNLRRGITKSCGCLAIENATRRVYKHGGYGTKEYRAWSAMHTRCQNPNCDHFPRYGARGIKVCERWSSFFNFLQDMGKSPSPKHSVERKDGNGDYEPNNCVWATATQQANNTSRNKKVSFNGVTLTLSEWERRTGIKQATISRRLKNHWPVSETLTRRVL